MNARHLMGVSRRGRANLVGLLVLALTITASTFALDPAGPPKKPSMRRDLVAAPGDPGVVYLGTPEEPVKVRTDGTIVGAPTPSPSKESANAPAGRYSATATASLVYQGTGQAEGGRAAGVSAVNVVTDGGRLHMVDRLGTPLIEGDPGKATAVARIDTLPGLQTFATQAASPGAGNQSTNAVLTPSKLPLGVTAIGGHATANTTGTEACVADGQVADAASEVVTGNLLTGYGPTALGTDTDDPNVKAGIVGLDGAGSSGSLVELEPAVLQEEFSTKTVKTGAMAVTARAKIRVPMLTIFPHSVYKVEIRFLAPIELMATAGGVPGTARARLFGALLDADRPLVSITSLFSTQYLTGRFFSTEDGIHIHLGNGGELHLGSASVLAAAGGRSAHGVVDYFRLRLPDRVGPLHLSVDPDLGELIVDTGSTINDTIAKLNKGFDLLPLPKTKIPTNSVREIRIGHMEVDVQVPVGGVKCQVTQPFHFGITDKDTGLPAE